MRIHELAFCCYAYAALERYDRRLVELREATGQYIDPAATGHTEPLFKWLRNWGCRQFARGDEQLARESLLDWWDQWAGVLPAPETGFEEIGPAGLELIGSAYADLRWRPASSPRTAGGKQISFGPTGASKTLHAIRPNACPPWDESIRKALGLPDSGDGYRSLILRGGEELAEAAAGLSPGITLNDLPARVGRAAASPIKLFDEYNWILHTKRLKPPPPETLAQWTAWATGS